MCFKRIARKIKAFFVEWLPDRGYRYVVIIMTVLWSIGVIINPPLIFILTLIWTIIAAGLSFSYYRFKQAVSLGKKYGSWSLKSVYQQFKDWREGRRRRKLHNTELQYGN